MHELIGSSPDPIAVASVSCLEVAWLAKKGRITLDPAVPAIVRGTPVFAAHRN
jgi:PIN domain nuclease of toxin-antitoxin system